MKQQSRIQRLFAEFVVVVVGVAVALAADSWRRGLAERASEHEYSQRLVAELSDGRKSIERNHNRVIAAVAAIDTLLRLGTPIDSAAVVRLGVRAADYEYNPAGILHDLTYRELLSTGNLGLIRDQPVRNAITNYYRLAYRVSDISTADSDRSREFANAIRSAVGENPAVVVESEALLTPDARNRVLALFRTGSDWEGQLRLLRSRLTDRREALKGLLAETQSLVAAVNAN